MVDLNGIINQKQMMVGTVAAAIEQPDETEGLKRPDKVLVQTLTSNSVSLFIKKGADVVSDGSTGGFELPPGCNIILPTSMYEEFYAIASVNGQRVQLTYLGGV